MVMNGQMNHIWKQKKQNKTEKISHVQSTRRHPSALNQSKVPKSNKRKVKNAH